MLKTMNDFIEEHANLFPSDVDEATQATAIDWFGYRKVAHNQYFPSWFYRTMAINYSRYMEILRVEARAAGSEYDWLVTKYEERQVQTQDTDTKQGSVSDTRNQSSTRRFTAGVSEVITNAETDTTNDTTTTEHSGTDNNQMTRNLAQGGTVRDEKQSSGTNNGTRTPNLTTAINGTDSRTDTGNSNTTRTPNLSSVTKNSETDSSRHGVLQRQAPYDQDYAGLDASTNAAVAHGVGASGVDTGSIEVLNNSASNAGFPALVIKNPTASSDELQQNASVGYSENVSTGQETNIQATGATSNGTNSETKQETGTETNNITTSGSETDVTTRNLTDTGTESNNRTLDLTDETTNEGTIQREGRQERTRSGSDVDSTTVNGSGSKQENSTVNRTGLERTIFTGRSGQSPQLLLSDAVEFIKSTSAWLWLYRQLDRCFMMVYDLDDYEDDFR